MQVHNTYKLGIGTTEAFYYKLCYFFYLPIDYIVDDKIIGKY